eukprot:711787-Rhodomonas_salina.1
MTGGIRVQEEGWAEASIDEKRVRVRGAHAVPKNGDFSVLPRSHHMHIPHVRDSSCTCRRKWTLRRRSKCTKRDGALEYLVMARVPRVRQSPVRGKCRFWWQLRDRCHSDLFQVGRPAAWAVAVNILD